MGISPDKLVLGLPWYGYDYTCLSFEKDICTLKQVPFRGVNCSDAAGRQLEYGILQDILTSRAVNGRQWDPVQLSPFFHYQDTAGAIHQVWYDDPESLSIKYAYATDWAKLRGIALWNSDLLDYSDIPRAKQQTEDMWNTLPSL